MDEYLATWRPKICIGATPWLFPDPDGGHIDHRYMSADLQRRTKELLGVPVSAHQFRHLSAELYLKSHPDKLALIANHLGHRDINTTRYYYARSKQKESTAEYHRLLAEERQRANKRRSPRRGRSAAEDEFDAVNFDTSDQV